MSNNEPNARLREINRIVSEVASFSPDQRASAIANRCGNDTELATAVSLRIGYIETGESSRDLGADFSKSYEFLELIGKGGMGTVYRATQTRLGRDVAVKKVKKGIGLNYQHAVSSFLTEAKLTASIKHPGIVPVYDVGTLDGQPCFAMELVEGKSLSEAIDDKNTSFSINTTMEFVATLADALAEAHRIGIVHRDLKPSNVLLDSRGQPRITDFGIARLIGDSNDTSHHSAAGSIGYVAPEQALGKPIDQTADVFSLGAILFTLLTGKPPFVDSTTKTISAFAETVLESRTPSVQSQTGRVERRLAAICQRCLQPNPASRYQAANELASDLRRLLRWRKRKAAVVIASAAFALLLTVGAFFAERSLRYDANAAQTKADVNYATEIEAASRARYSGDIKQTRTLLTQLKPTNNGIDRRGIEWDYLWYEANREKHVFGPRLLSSGDFDLSPDGTLLATGSPDRVVQLWNRMSWSKIGELRGHINHLKVLAFSPNGNFLVSGSEAYFVPVKNGDGLTDGEIIIWDVKTRRQIAIAKIPKHDINAIVFAADSERFFVLADEIREYDLAGVCLDTIEISGNSLAISPNGEQLAVGLATGEVTVVALRSKSKVGPLAGHTDAVSSVRFDSSGNILTASLDGTIKWWDADSYRNRTIVDQGLAVLDFCFDEENSRVICAASNTVFISRLGSAIGNHPVPLTGHEFPIHYLEFDPIRNELITTGRRGAIRVWDLTPTLSPAVNRVFRSDLIEVSCISASQNSDLIAAVIDEDGATSRLHFYRLDEPAFHVVVNGVKDQIQDVAVHPNGTMTAVLCSDGQLDQSIFMVDEKFQVSHSFGEGLQINHVVFSPNGEYIATAGHSHTTIWKNDGGLLCRLPTHLGNAEDVAFSHDSKMIAVTSDSREVSVWDIEKKLVAYSLENRPRNVDGAYTTNTVDFSPNGKFVATGSFYGVRIWKATDGEPLETSAKTFEETFVSTDVAFLSDDRLICCCDDGVSLWQPESGKLIRKWQHERGMLTEVESMANSMFVSAYGIGRDEVRVWHADKVQPHGSIVHDSNLPIGRLNDMTFLPDQSKLIVAGGLDGGTLIVMDAEDCAILETHQPHSQQITSIDASRDGRWVATASTDQTVKILASSDYSTVRTLTGHSETVKSVAFSPDGNLIATAGGRDETFRLWDRESGSLLYRHDCDGYVFDVDFGPAGEMVIVSWGTDDGKWIDVFRAESRRKMYSLQTPYLREVISHPDGLLAAYCTKDEIVFWNVATGTETKRISTTASSAAFTSNATRIMYPERQLVIHHVRANKQMVRIPTGTWPKSEPRLIAIDSNGRFFAVASSEGVVQCWRAK